MTSSRSLSRSQEEDKPKTLGERRAHNKLTSATQSDDCSALDELLEKLMKRAVKLKEAMDQERHLTATPAKQSGKELRKSKSSLRRERQAPSHVMEFPASRNSTSRVWVSRCTETGETAQTTHSLFDFKRRCRSFVRDFDRKRGRLLKQVQLRRAASQQGGNCECIFRRSGNGSSNHNDSQLPWLRRRGRGRKRDDFAVCVLFARSMMTLPSTCFIASLGFFSR